MKLVKRFLTGTTASIMSLAMLMTLGFTSTTYAEPEHPRGLSQSAR